MAESKPTFWQLLYMFIYNIALRFCIRKAKRLHKLTGYHYMVMNWKGIPRVFARRQFKQLVNSGALKYKIQDEKKSFWQKKTKRKKVRAASKFFRGMTIRDFDKISLYSTNAVPDVKE